MGVSFIMQYAFKSLFFSTYLAFWQLLFFTIFTYISHYIPTDNVYFQYLNYFGIIKAIMVYFDLRIWIFTVHKAIEYWKS